MQTYLKGRVNLVDLYGELIQLYKFHTHDQENEVENIIHEMTKMRDHIEAELGDDLIGKQILEIGPGQKLPHLYYFSRSNRYTGIDIDLPLQRLSIKGLLRMWQVNGPVRLVKTLGRHLLGIDATYKREMEYRLGSKNPRAELRQMDVGKMTFAANSFDCIFSISIFEHLPDPSKVMQEIARVLKPGGIAYIKTHLYTSDTGIHDPKVYIDRDDIPYWAHLQKDTAHLVNSNCYLNKMHMAQYERLFNEIWPGSTFDYVQNGTTARIALQKCREAGKLMNYTDKELMTNELVTTWRKPG